MEGNKIMAVKPIEPGEVVDAKQYSIPDEIFEAFNNLIAKNFHSGSSNFKQKEVVEEILCRLRDKDLNLDILKNINRDDASLESLIYANYWLDVEDIYRKVGWIVKYDKPSYNESYDANFTFKKNCKEK